MFALTLQNRRVNPTAWRLGTKKKKARPSSSKNTKYSYILNEINFLFHQRVDLAFSSSVRFLILAHATKEFFSYRGMIITIMGIFRDNNYDCSFRQHRIGEV